jgi:hypothetical protein
MRSTLPAVLWLAVLPVLAPPSQAAPLPPASQRYQAATTQEVPSFQRHVVPLLGRLGCNGRSCHGSFQGQGGFRLSLFGYDFQADHEALLGGQQPRVNLAAPADSLILRKPTRMLAHGGGKRMEPGGWEYRLLLRWIESGAAGVGTGQQEAAFVALEVQPREIVFQAPGQTVQLRVTAHWSDGTSEDVTPLCRFRSNDESIATVDASGVVQAAAPGDTAVVAFYDNGIVPVPVLLPVSDRLGPRYPDVPTPTRIDELVVAKLRKLGIVPSELCTDAEFLRRVSLDLTGTLPPPAEVEAFLADPSADKRRRKIDELLQRPAYAAWWATKLCDFTGNSERNGPLGGEQGLNLLKARQWYAWLYRRIEQNVPYDQIVEGIVLAVGRRPDQSYDDYCREMSAYFRKDDPADFAARDTMPYFWTRRTVGRSEDKALSFAHAFLGVSLQCAQCHKHPYDQWTKQDFDQFAAFFDGVRYGAGPRDQMQQMKQAVGLGGLDEDSGQYKRKFVELLQAGHILPFKDLAVPQPRTTSSKRPASTSRYGRVITPRLLGGEEVIASTYPDPRQPLIDWMRQDDHPYFARAFVNRVWSNYFHVGLIDPPDDLNLANPPSNPALLDDLAERFIRSGYDMKWLHREICNSRTYQGSWRPNDTNRHDERNYSRAVLRRLPAEVIYDAVAMATASDDALAALHADPLATRAIGLRGFAGGRSDDTYAVNLFGKPPRAINCDCERSNEPALLQTVYLRNDPELLRLLDRPDGWLRQVARSQPVDPDALLRQAYLRTLGRLPDERERAIALEHFAAEGDPIAALRNLLWALINTKEFIVNR